MIEWTTYVSFAARTGIQTYQHRHLIQKWWTRARAYLNFGRTQIVVTGHAGAGKTALASQLHGRARELGFSEPDQSKNVEVLAIDAGAWSKLVRVLPGQTGLRTAGEIEAFSNNPDLEGVIHVVDYGFTVPRDPAIALAILTEDGIDTVEKIRERSLQVELSTLAALISDLRKSIHLHQRPRWLIIAVNKVDLYPAERDKALLRYHPNGGSPFSAMLRSLQQEVGSSNLHIHVVQVCAYETDFSWNGEAVPTSLPRREQDRMLVDFMKTLAAISETTND